jgi:hypothetical protein
VNAIKTNIRSRAVSLPMLRESLIVMVRLSNRLATGYLIPYCQLRPQ